MVLARRAVLELTLLPHAQAMDLPSELWVVVSQCMTTRDWARACCTNRATYALRRLLVAAEVRGELGTHEGLTRQLQHNRWPACHTLTLNLRQLAWAVDTTITQAQKDQISRACSALPLLRCLHLIGRDEVPLMECSFEGMLASLLARHASVLSLQVKTIAMQLHLPNLVLNFGPWWAHHDEWQPHAHAQVFPAISTLKALKTLCTQSPGLTQIYQHADLKGCKHLQCVAVQNVQFCDSIYLPAGCALHAAGDILSLDTLVSHIHCSRVTVHHKIRMKLDVWYHKCLQEHYRCLAHSIYNVKQLRLILDKGNLKEQHVYTDRVQEDITFGPDSTPRLEVLELDAPCSMTVSIDQASAEVGCHCRSRDLAVAQEPQAIPTSNGSGHTEAGVPSVRRPHVT